MKKTIILFLLLLIMPFAYAKIEEVTLQKYDSYMRNGVNITLMNIDKERTKFIVCVNGAEYIVPEKGITQELFIIDVNRIDKDSVKMDVEINCKGCVCEGACYNKRCFPNPKYIPKEKTTPEIETEGLEGENGEVGSYAIVVFVILVLIIIAVAYYVIKKKD